MLGTARAEVRPFCPLQSPCALSRAPGRLSAHMRAGALPPQPWVAAQRLVQRPPHLIFFQLPAPWWMLTASAGGTLLTWMPAALAPQPLGMLAMSCEGAQQAQHGATGGRRPPHGRACVCNGHAWAGRRAWAWCLCIASPAPSPEQAPHLQQQHIAGWVVEHQAHSCRRRSGQGWVDASVRCGQHTTAVASLRASTGRPPSCCGLRPIAAPLAQPAGTAAGWASVHNRQQQRTAGGLRHILECGHRRGHGAGVGVLQWHGRQGWWGRVLYRATPAPLLRPMPMPTSRSELHPCQAAWARPQHGVRMTPASSNPSPS